MCERIPPIEIWSVITDQYLAFPVEKTVLASLPWYLVGQIFDHPSFSNNAVIMSSKIRCIDLQQKKAKTENSTYLLGEPNPHWQDWLSNNQQNVSSLVGHLSAKIFN